MPRGEHEQYRYRAATTICDIAFAIVREPRTVESLAKEHKVIKKTVYRMLAAMETMRWPIHKIGQRYAMDKSFIEVRR